MIAQGRAQEQLRPGHQRERAVTAAPIDVAGFLDAAGHQVAGAHLAHRLACVYVSQVSSHTMPSLRLDYLFRGSEGAAPHGG